MKRTIVFGLATLALALFSRTELVATASAREVTARDADGQRPATLEEIRDLLRDLRDVSDELSIAQDAIGASSVSAEATRETGATADWRWDECRFQSLDSALWTAREETLTAECATDKADVDYGTLVSVGQCESGWNRLASNGGRYLGLFQHAASSYVGRIRTYEPRAWDHGLSERWQNSRGQIVMTARMVASVGWGPWSCY